MTPQDSSYPRVYRISAGWKIAQVLLAACTSAFGMFGMVYFVVIPVPGPHPNIALALTEVCSVAITLFGFIGIGDAYASKVILSADSIEINDLRRPRKLRRDEIASRQLVYPSNSPPTIVLRPIKPDLPTLIIPKMLNTDETFDAWIESIPVYVLPRRDRS